MFEGIAGIGLFFVLGTLVEVAVAGLIMGAAELVHRVAS